MFRQKELVEGVKGDREVEKLLSKMSTPQSPHHRHHYHRHVLDSGGLTPGSSSYSDGASAFDSASSSFDVFSKYQTPTPSHRVDQLITGSADPDYYYRRTSNGFVTDQDLAREFQALNLGATNGVVNHNNNEFRHFGLDPDAGFRTADRNVTRIPPLTSETCKSFVGGGGGRTADLSGLGGGASHSPIHAVNNHLSIDDKMRCAVGQRGGWNVGGDSMHIITTAENQSASLYSGTGGYYDSLLSYHPLGDAAAAAAAQLGNDWYRNGTTIQNPSSVYRSCTATDPLQLCRMAPIASDDVLNPRACSQHHLSLYKPYSDQSLLRQCGISHNWNMAAMNSSDLLHSQQQQQQQQALNMENAMYNNPSSIRAARVRSSDQEMGVGPVENRGLYPHSVMLMKNPKKLDPYACEDTYIIQGKRLNGSVGKYDPSRVKLKNNHGGSTLQVLGDKNLELNALFHPDRIYDNGRSLVGCNQMISQPTFSALSEVQGCVYLMAKDQHGCRFLQKQFEEGTCEDVQKIFDEIVDHIVELMMNPFGNYLIQKLLEVCREEQRLRIVHMVTREPGELVRISLNTHGTRVVQKLIETLGTREEISLVVRALEPGFIDLIKDLNGNHVVQRCLQCLSSEDNKFIFDAAAKFCVDIATHRHGCCVLQRCIDHSYGEQQAKLISEICASGLLLAQDPFGNYVVQYILEKKIPAVSAQLVTQFEGHYVHLSMQKFSSHVVEKCLKFYEECRPVIVHELLSVPHFEQVLQDQYANYVIQSALDVTKGALHDTLVAAVRPHTILRTNPHCKKIFSRGLLKK